MGIDTDALQEISLAANDPRNKYALADRMIDRVMMADCDMYEWGVLRFVLNRTLRFGKDYEHIPEHHFLHGVWTGDGQCLQPRLRIGKSKLYDTINSLCDKKMLLKTTDRGPTRHRKTFYMINLSFDFANVAKGSDMGGQLNLSKKRKKTPDQSATRTNVSVLRTNESAQRTAILTSDTKDRYKHAQPAAAPSPNTKGLATATIQEAIAASLARSAAARAKHKAKGNMTGILKVYEDAFHSTYPDDPFVTPSGATWIAFYRSMKRANIQDQAKFVEWLVTNYVATAKARFPFLLKESNHPPLKFITSKIETFVLAYTDDSDPNRQVDRRIRERQLGLKTEELSKNELEQLRKKVTVLEQEYEQLKSSGPSNAKAEEAVAQRGAAKHRKLTRALLKRPKSHPDFGEW